MACKNSCEPGLRRKACYPLRDLDGNVIMHWKCARLYVKLPGCCDFKPVVDCPFGGNLGAGVDVLLYDPPVPGEYQSYYTVVSHAVVSGGAQAHCGERESGPSPVDTFHVNVSLPPAPTSGAAWLSCECPGTPSAAVSL
jgi:hypothetical protein